MRALITGASGLIGSALSDALLARGDEVIGLTRDPERARTNFVLFKVRGDRMAFLARLRERGILMIDYPHGQIRAVTHHGIEEADVDAAMRAARDALRESGVAPHRRTPVPAGGD